eukprot:1160610-Pelagomonas_calceolata.AAC.10
MYAANLVLTRGGAEHFKDTLVADSHDLRNAICRNHVCSQSSADQRRGRAGRTGPGLCYRLWDESTALEEATVPEIMELPTPGPDRLAAGSWQEVEACEYKGSRGKRGKEKGGQERLGKLYARMRLRKLP